MTLLTYPLIFQQFAAVSGALANRVRIRACSACNRNAAARYLQLFDLAAAPAPGAVPYAQWSIAGGTLQTLIGSDFFGPDGFQLVNGLAYGLSTTSGTYTAATAADHDFNATYEGRQQ